ncbi:putative ABC transporter ATP-binding protein YxlF [Planctomycetes bacterium Pla163]|uniref:Putative ABC transporter ATP-binding protein YxlF n=1 Tax=Rohdeia mirabilis TaxID=2528008 RepID=A0A518CWB6_9BACT|nr:putative ABC transporter ATP-binding protein YxlF [Planctomycetes bacterium Pla163]
MNVQSESTHDLAADDALDPVLDARDLTVRYRRDVVIDRASFELRRGETTFLLGANGAGKTTLLRALIAAAPVRSGSVRLGEVDVLRRPGRARSRIGFVPDQLDLPAWMSGREALGFVGAHFSCWRGSRAETMLADFGVDGERPVGELSRGQGVLVMLAAALGHEPDLLLLDEPFANLDPGARVLVQRALLEHVDTSRTACLISTHDLDVAARLADRVLLLEDGRVHEIDAVEPVEPRSLVRRREELLEAAFATEVR